MVSEMSSFNRHPLGPRQPLRVLIFLLNVLISISYQQQDVIIHKRSQTNSLISFILEPPSRIDFYNSTGALIPCAALGDPKPSVWWVTVRDGYKVTEVPGLRHLRSDGSLVFPPFKANDYRQDIHATVYRCVAANSYGVVGSKDVHVRGVVKQDYNVQVFDEFSIEGNTAVLRCNIPAFAKDFVTVSSWIRDDSVTIVSAAHSGGRYSVFPGGELHIRETTFEDGLAYYRCITRNKLTGEIAASSVAGKLVVSESQSNVPPRITHSKAKIDVNKGLHVELPCAAQGSPQPTYNWFKMDRKRSGGLIPIKTDHHKFVQLQGSLLIRDVKLEDSGKYLCMANNTSGREKTETELLVRVPLQISVHPKVQRVDMGGLAVFSCNVTGYPVDKVRWVKDQEVIVPNTRFRVPAPETLHIRSVRREDKGLYQCYAFSDKESIQTVAQLKLGEEAPVLKETFFPQTIDVGKTVSLKCIATGNPLPQITWSIDEGLIPETGSRLSVGDFVTTSSEVVSYVNISNSKVEDGGLYGCHANNDVKRITHLARINVKGPPLVRPMKDRTAVEGSPLVVHCPYAGYPVDEIYWEHNKRNDGGDYICVVKSSSGSSSGPSGLRASSSLRVAVQSPPVIDPFSFPRFLEEGSRSKVLCSVIKGDPPINIKWLKDGQPLISGGVNGISITSLDEFSMALVFSKVSLANLGNYTCLANNMVASANYTSEAIVHAHPRWTVEPLNTVAVTGKDTMIHCQVDGFPEPVIEWKRATGSLSSPYKGVQVDGRLHKLDNGSLEIKAVDKSDAGFYMCQASNGIGSGISTVVELQVRSPANFKEEFKVESVRKGGQLVIKCQAFGDKPLTVLWKKDGQAFSVSSDKRYQITETITDEGITTEMKVDSADRRDSSLFTCNAANGYGSDETNIQVIVQERPDAPTKANVGRVESRSISVNWSPPYSGNSPILHYVVEIKEVTEEWDSHSKQQRVPGTETRAAVSGLWPGTAYHIRLMAENSLGKSEPGIVLHAITELEVPAEAPADVSAEAVGSKSIRVKWKPPMSMRYRNHVKGYYIGYKAVASEDVFTYKTVEVTTQNGPYDTVISTLQRLTKYTVLVKAFNRKGSGPPSDEVYVKTNDMDVPSPPRLELISATHKSIEIKWETSDAAKSVLGFTIFRKEEIAAWEEFAVNSDLRAYTFRDLLCGTKYQVYLTGHNEAGNGLPSNSITTKTQGTVPIAPSQGSFLKTNGTWTMLHLDEWQPGGCPIKYFAVQYRSDITREWQPLTQPINGDQERYIIKDLLPETWYRLRVSAHNEAGTTEAEYTFSTLTHDRSKAMGQPGWSISDEDVQWINVVVFPVIATIIIVGSILIVVYGIRRKPRTIETDGNSSIKESMTYSEQVQMSDMGGVKHSRTNLYEKGNTPKECLYFPASFETNNDQCLQVSGDHYSISGPATDDTFASSSYRMQPPSEERTYEVPFLVTKPKTPSGSRFAPGMPPENAYSYPSRAQQQVNKVGSNVVVRLWPKPDNDFESVRAHYGSVGSVRTYDERGERPWDGALLLCGSSLTESNLFKTNISGLDLVRSPFRRPLSALEVTRYRYYRYDDTDYAFNQRKHILLGLNTMPYHPKNLNFIDI